VWVSALKPAQAARLNLPAAAATWLRSAVSATEVETTQGPPPAIPSWADIAAIVPLLVMVVLASIWLINAASTLGGRLGWSE
jgi:hypothetical protein